MVRKDVKVEHAFVFWSSAISILTLSKIYRVCFGVTTFLWLSYGLAQPPQVDLIDRLDAAIEDVYQIESQFPERAATLYDSLYSVCLEAQYFGGAIKSGMYEGILHNDHGRYLLALNKYRKAQSLLSKTETGILEAKVYNNMGVTHNFRGSNDSAATYFHKALKIVEGVQDTNFLILLHSNLGSSLVDLERYDAALKYAENGLKLGEAFGDSLRLTESLLNYANTRRRVGEFLNATSAYQRALDIASNLENDHLIYLVLTAIADMHYQATAYELARRYSEKALQAAERHGDPYYLVHALQNFGLMHVEPGLWTVALEHLDASVALARNTGATDLLSKSLLYKSEAYAKMGRDKEAYAILVEQMALEDSLQNAEQSRMVMELETLYEVEKKDRALAGQAFKIERANEKETFQRTLIILLFLALAVVIALGVVSYKLSKQKSAFQNLQLERSEQESALKSIDARLHGEEEERQRLARELHDGIGGRMAILQARMRSGFEPEMLAADLADTDQELRRIAHSLMPEIFMKYGFRQALFAFIEQAREHDVRIEFGFEGPEVLIASPTALHAYRMVQELVTNAIKHADADLIHVQVHADEHSLMISVEDDGSGLPDAVRDQKEGLTALRQRLRLVNGNMHIESDSETGTGIHIELPLKAQL